MTQKIAILFVMLAPLMITPMFCDKVWGIHMEEDERKAYPAHVPAPVVTPRNDVPLYVVFGTLSFLATVELIKSWF